MSNIYGAVDADLFRGRPVVVIGNAPSINDVDLSLLEGVGTIGVNRAVQKVTTDALVVVDEPMVHALTNALEMYQGTVLTWDKTPEDVWANHTPQAFSLVGNIGNPSTWKWPESLDDPLVRHGTTPAYALQVALLSGASAIGILGVDYTAPSLAKKGKPSHFYGYAGKGYVCGACGSYFSERKLKIDRGDMVCPNCQVLNKVHAIKSTGGGSWTGRDYAFYNRFRLNAEQRGIDCFNLSPCKASALSKAKWRRKSCAEFTREYK